MQSDREHAQEMCEMTQHHFVEEYYGDRCEICGLFYPFGCAPWDDDTDEYEPQEEYYLDQNWFDDHAEDGQDGV